MILQQSIDYIGNSKSAVGKYTPLELELKNIGMNKGSSLSLFLEMKIYVLYGFFHKQDILPFLPNRKDT